MKKIKVVAYNILFGMKGNSVIDMVLSNLAMHGLRPALSFGLLPQWIRRITVPIRNHYLTDAIKLIKKHSPDILCLNEVLLNIHREELEKYLLSMGFKTIVYGICKHHSPPFQISLVLATKAEAIEIPFKMTMADRPGGAGGATSLYIPTKNLAILGVHLALSGPILEEEFKEVNKWIEEQKQLKRKILIIGDFNLEKEKIDEKISALVLFKETASPTCPSFKTFLKSSECVDHIFFDQNFTQTASGTEQGFSDHKLIWSELNSN